MSAAARAWIAILAVAACRAPDEARERYARTDGAERLEAARVLAVADDGPLARWVEERPGAVTSLPEGPWLLAAAARRHPAGARWMLARLAPAKTLDDLFPELHLRPEEAMPVVVTDVPAELARALVEVLGDDPHACLWAAHLAAAERGAATRALREAVAAPGVERACVRDGLASSGAPDPVPTPLLEALGPPRNESESALLRRWYVRALEASLDGLEAADVEEAARLLDAWDAAFPRERTPLDPGDLEALGYLRARDTGRSAFADVVSFLARHRRFHWLAALEPYARAGEWPSNGVSQVCHASAAECADLLRTGLPGVAPAAADVAPALDLTGGDMVLMTACDLLSEDEARALASKGLGAGMPDEVRETASTCLELKAEVVPAMVLAQPRGRVGHHGTIVGTIGL